MLPSFFICNLLDGFMRKKEAFTRQTVLVGISGGSAAGKTMVAGLLAKALEDISPAVVEVDRYFRDNSHLSPDELAKLNYDIPDALNFDQLEKDLKELKSGSKIAIPHYDYATHSANPGAEKINPSRLVIVEGILLFHPQNIKPLIDYRVFVDAERNERLRRRIARDTVERGRTKESVIHQFNDTVEPAFEKYTRPTCNSADFILDWNPINTEDLAKLAYKIKSLVLY